MDGWLRNAMCASAAITLLNCGCATVSRRSLEERFSEDLQTGGFSIVFPVDGEIPKEFHVDGERSDAMTVALTDSESTDMLMEWFRHRPGASGTLETALLQGLEQPFQEGEFRWPTLSIETTRFRVNIGFAMIALETRRSSTDEWTRTSWGMREEDGELRDWAFAQIKEKYTRIARERGFAGDSEEFRIGYDPQR